MMWRIITHWRRLISTNRQSHITGKEQKTQVPSAYRAAFRIEVAEKIGVEIITSKRLLLKIVKLTLRLRIERKHQSSIES